MCSQACLAKMKILCLNTVQVLFRDAFYQFANNLSNQSFSSNTSLKAKKSNNQGDEHNRNISPYKCSTPHHLLSCHEKLSTSNNELNTDDLSCVSNRLISENSTNNQNCQDQLINSLNATLSQQVLCNLMENLVDVINKQCVKQLPELFLGSYSPKTEKKKRKRKRKRKKSNLSGDMVIDNEISCSSTGQELCKRKDSQMRQKQKNEHLIDKIKVMESQASMERERIRTMNKINAVDKHNRSSKRKIQSTEFVLKNKLKINELSNESLRNESNAKDNEIKKCLPSSTIDSLSKYQFVHDKEELKRKRDDSSDYINRKRITSARKPPTIYKRRNPSSSSSLSTDNSFDDSSNSYSSSTNEE